MEQTLHKILAMASDIEVTEPGVWVAAHTDTAFSPAEEIKMNGENRALMRCIEFIEENARKEAYQQGIAAAHRAVENLL